MNIIGTKIAAGLIGTAALGGMMVPAGQMIKENIAPASDNQQMVEKLEDRQIKNQEGEQQAFDEKEKMNGNMNMKEPPEKPEEDDDGTKYPKPDGEMQLQDGEKPEMPNGELGNLPEKPSDDDDGTKYPKLSEDKQMENAPEKPSEDDDGTKYPISENQKQ